MTVQPLRVMLLGATGTIGSATAQALSRQGHEVVCVLRPRPDRMAESAWQHIQSLLSGTSLRWVDPCDAVALERDVLAQERFDAVVSCMASRTGSPQDAWRVDHQAHLDVLNAAKRAGVKQFVLLSAICVQKPKLAFQQAKLAFEQQLMQSGLCYAIVRPTAFFKSLSGQLQRVQNGKPFLLFGDGQATACKPISDEDLANFMASCLTDPDKFNRILPIGGPGPAITPRQQGEALFKLLGRPPKFKSVPVALLDVIIAVLSSLGKLIPVLADKAELARIGRYYATESMLIWNPDTLRYDADATPSHGTHTLIEAYAQWLERGAAPARGDHAVF